MSYQNESLSNVPGFRLLSYLVDILALEFFEELVKTVLVGFNTDRVEDFLDVLGGRLGVASKAEEKVSCEVLHFDGLFWKFIYQYQMHQV